MRLKPYFDPEDRPTNPIPDHLLLDNLFDGDNNPNDSNNVSTEDNNSVNDATSSPNDCAPDTDSPNIISKKVADNDTDDETLYEVEKLVASKWKDKKRLYKVKWKNYPTPTWEPEANIPEDLKKAFHINRTISGRRKKNKMKKKNQLTF